MTSTVGAGRVLETAAAMGFDAIWDNEGERHDLRTEDPTQLLEAGFGAEVGLGQFSVTVIDQANAMATLAAGGQRARAHFVQEVRRGDDVLYQETLPSPDAPRVLSAGQVVDIGYVLSQRAGRNDLAIQSGAWLSDAQPTDAWSLGYTRHLAVAIWLGSQDGQQPLRDSHGASIYGTGAPTYALLQVVDGVQAAMELTPVPFPPPVYAGDVDPVGSVPS